MLKSWRVRIILTLIAYLILSQFIPPLDAALFSLLILVLLTLLMHNLARVSSVNKIEAQVKEYLELYFRQRQAGLTLDGALTEVVYYRYPFNIQMKTIIFEGVRENNPENDDERVKRAIYLMFRYEEPVPPGPEALEVIQAVIERQYTLLKQKHDPAPPDTN